MAILTKITNNVGYITINNVEKLNALDVKTIREIDKTLDCFFDNNKVSIIILDSSGEKSFCAGGDIVSLYHDYIEQGKDPNAFFREEVELDKKILKSKKTIISFISGITMGGGVGLSINSDRVVSDERTLFAMPEAKLGIVPDVGVGYYFSKLEKHIGLYLSLTGARIKGSDLRALNLCTNYINSININEIQYRINNLNLKNLNRDEVLEKIDKVLNYYSENLVNTEFIENIKLIEKYFSKNSLEEIFVALRYGKDEFSKSTLKGLEKSSLLSLVIIFYKYFKGKELTLEETFELDLKILDFLNKIGNLKEGIRAVMIDKDEEPKFLYNSFEKINKLEIEKLLEL